MKLCGYWCFQLMVIDITSGHNLGVLETSSCFRVYREGSDSVLEWLGDVRLVTETECMCVLQGKSLAKDPADSVSQLAKTCRG